MLQIEQIIFNLFRIQFGREALKVKGYSCNMATIVVEGAWTSGDRNVAFEALEQSVKACNFTTGTVEVLIIP